MSVDIIQIRIIGQPGAKGEPGTPAEPGTGSTIKRFKVPGPHTYILPMGKTLFQVRMWAGGGGGGGAAGFGKENTGGAGGGAGCGIEQTFEPISSVSIIVGHGGEGGKKGRVVEPGHPGENGGLSQISFTNVSNEIVTLTVYGGGGGGGGFFGGIRLEVEAVQMPVVVI